MNTAAVGETTVERGRRSVLVVAVALMAVAAACGSGDDAGGAPGVPAPDDLDPGGIVDVLTTERQRRGILLAADDVLDDSDPTQARVWELRCRWVPEQAALVRGALPWPPPDTSDEWKAYVAATDGYWTQFEDTCDQYDPATSGAETDFREALRASEQAHLEACEALVMAVELRVDDDIDGLFCAYPEDMAIPVETFPDLPPELEEFVSGPST